MQSKPDANYKFICHVGDHFSKFRILFPCFTKEAEEISKNLIEKVFSIFGVPSILHSDNGREFVNDIIRAICVIWGANCNIVNGGVRCSQSQGFVEQGNCTIERMISARSNDTSTNSWSKWLPQIQCEKVILFK